MSLYNQLSVLKQERSPTGKMSDVWVVMCLDCGRRVIKRRSLCNACYARNYRNDTLWQYIPTEYLDDQTLAGQARIDEMICWFFTYDFDKLVAGFDEYTEGQWKISIFNETAIGNEPYRIHGDDFGMCNACSEAGARAVVRGLCRTCYNKARYVDGGVIYYPTKDYVENVEGYIYFALNHHPERVQDVAIEYGVRILKVEDSESRSSETPGS